MEGQWIGTGYKQKISILAVVILLALHNVARLPALVTALLIGVIALWTGADLCCMHHGDETGDTTVACVTDQRDMHEDEVVDAASSSCCASERQSDADTHGKHTDSSTREDGSCSACTFCCMCSASVLSASVYSYTDLVPSLSTVFFVVDDATVFAAYDLHVPPPNNA